MAGFIRKIFGHFGGKKSGEDATRKPVQKREQEPTANETATPSIGFGVKVAVPAEGPVRVPVVAQCNGNGGVQGLKWYADKLRVDDDGDVAQEFLSEVIPETRGPYNTKRPPRFESVKKTRPAKLKGPVCTHDGNVHQHVESTSGNLWA